MKKSFLILLSMLVFCGCAPSKDSPSGEDSNVTSTLAPGDEIASHDPSATLVTLSVPGMSCAEGCPPAVTSALAQCEGVKDVRVDFASKTATVSIDSASFEQQAAIEALANFGFADSEVQN